MKKVTLTVCLLILFSVSAYLQNVPTYPIPSYNVNVNGTANFIPFGSNLSTLGNTKEKRSQNVAVRGSYGSYATVWVYSLDGLDVLGPYVVYAGETLSVPIDDRDWGVLVQTSYEIQVDVYVTGGSKMPSLIPQPLIK